MRVDFVANNKELLRFSMPNRSSDVKKTTGEGVGSSERGNHQRQLIGSNIEEKNSRINQREGQSESIISDGLGFGKTSAKFISSSKVIDFSKNPSMVQTTDKRKEEPNRKSQVNRIESATTGIESRKLALLKFD